MWVEPVVLEGSHVRLEPLMVEHADILGRSFDLSLFQYFGSVRPATANVEGLRGYVRAVNAMPNVVAFATILKSTGEPVGSTTFMDIREENRGLEIGMTWILPPHQGTVVNPEAKLLMIRHAFEKLKCVRLQLKCDGRNKQSQAGILKLGAKFEGCLRKHMVLPDGFVRDTMMYSIIAEEAPGIVEKLTARVNRAGNL